MGNRKAKHLLKCFRLKSSLIQLNIKVGSWKARAQEGQSGVRFRDSVLAAEQSRHFIPQQKQARKRGNTNSHCLMD